MNLGSVLAPNLSPPPVPVQAGPCSWSFQDDFLSTPAFTPWLLPRMHGKAWTATSDIQIPVMQALCTAARHDRVPTRESHARIIVLRESCILLQAKNLGLHASAYFWVLLSGSKKHIHCGLEFSSLNPGFSDMATLRLSFLTGIFSIQR